MTRQQQWAKLALERVQKRHDKASESDYRTLCMKMPVLIKQSGPWSGITQGRGLERGKALLKSGEVAIQVTNHGSLLNGRRFFPRDAGALGAKGRGIGLGRSQGREGVRLLAEAKREQHLGTKIGDHRVRGAPAAQRVAQRPLCMTEEALQPVRRRRDLRLVEALEEVRAVAR